MPDKRPVRISIKENEYRTEVKIGSHLIVADEPYELGGKDEGPSPFEYLLTGLGTCMAITLRMYANHKKWPLDGVEINLNFYQEEMRDKELKTIIKEQIVFHGDLDNVQKQRLIEISKKCPTAKMLAGEVVIK